MTQAEQIYDKNFPDGFKAFFLGAREEKCAIAAIQEALEASYNVKEADRKVFQELRTQLAAKEKELQELREYKEMAVKVFSNL